MRAIKLVVPAALAMAGLLICTTATSYGKPEYAKKEDKKCAFCHSSVGAKEVMQKNLTDAGKYYKDHEHKLDGYKGK
jgi:hypothetical protein